MAVVKNYVEEEGLRMIDFFKQMDKDRGGTISREEFVDGLAVRPRNTLINAIPMLNFHRVYIVYSRFAGGECLAN